MYAASLKYSFGVILPTTCVQVRSVPRRSCTANAGSYCNFLLSGDEGSDSMDEEDEIMTNDELYDATTEGMPTFDKKREIMIGLRRIIKSFGDHGNFCGIAYGVDDDKNKRTHNIANGTESCYSLILSIYFTGKFD